MHTHISFFEYIHVRVPDYKCNLMVMGVIAIGHPTCFNTRERQFSSKI